MNLLADEDVDRPIVERLRREGYHVEYVAEMAFCSLLWGGEQSGQARCTKRPFL